MKLERTERSRQVWQLIVALGQELSLPYIDFIAASNFRDWRKTLFIRTSYDSNWLQDVNRDPDLQQWSYFRHHAMHYLTPIAVGIEFLDEYRHIPQARVDVLRRAAEKGIRAGFSIPLRTFAPPQAALMTFGPDARPVTPPFNQRIDLPWFEFTKNGLGLFWPWGLSITSYKLFVVLAAILILTGVWLLMTRTRFGLIMRATQQDREMSQAFGVPVDNVFAYVFGLGAALAAIGAVLVVPVQQAHYLMGHDPLLLSFIVVIIGGLGSLPGTVIAAVLIGMSDGIISVFFSPTLAKIVATMAVAMVLVFRPQGLVGKAAS